MRTVEEPLARYRAAVDDLGFDEDSPIVQFVDSLISEAEQIDLPIIMEELAVVVGTAIGVTAPRDDEGAGDLAAAGRLILVATAYVFSGSEVGAFPPSDDPNGGGALHS